MPRLKWDESGTRYYETGVKNGVLYPQASTGTYPTGVVWNGLVTVTESPSGAEANAQYADDMKYLNLYSAEEFGATIEAFTYPDEFEECDGSASIAKGVSLGQQGRKAFGFCYKTTVGNDVDADLGYKLHLIYGAKASPSEKAYSTINDSPEPITFSWEVTTTPIPVEGYRPTSQITIDSRDVDVAKLKELEDILYGSDSSEARLPLPEEVIDLFEGSSPTPGPSPTPTTEYVLTTDTEVVAGKTYYERSGVEGSYEYTPVTPEEGDNPSEKGWYEAVTEG